MYWQRSGLGRSLRINSLLGGADIAWRNVNNDSSIFRFEQIAIVGHLSLLQDGESVSYWWFHKLASAEAYVPYWPVVLVCSALAGVPWLPARFSLRTLLVATTLVAVVLGMIVWLR